jgi:predicted nucleic acid-binding protein
VSAKRIVLDANILIRAILGARVAGLIATNSIRTQMLASETAFLEAEKHLPSILERRGADPELVRLALENLERLRLVVTPIPLEVFSWCEPAARERLRGRDEDDWHVLGLALALGCPIWTEDADFFGTGATTWKTDRIQIFFED